MPVLDFGQATQCGGREHLDSRQSLAFQRANVSGGNRREIDVGNATTSPSARQGLQIVATIELKRVRPFAPFAWL
jgi:hypothetical protein